MDDRLSRVELRRACLDGIVRRSVSLDTQSRALIGFHYDNRSLTGEGFDTTDLDDDIDGDGNDQRCHSPLPCKEGCRGLFTKLMSPMISSVAIDRSVSLSRDEPPRPVESPSSTSAEPGVQVPPKQAAFASRKSVRGERSMNQS